MTNYAYTIACTCLPLTPAGYSYPYVVAILPKTVEVRNIQTQALVQQIELPSAKHLNQGKLLYIASGTQIWRLTPYSLAAQVDQLVEMCEYKEAVSLLDQIEPILLENKADKVKRIKMMYANDLFMRGQYETALTMFQELEADPELVISLYPEVIAGEKSSENTMLQEGVELADEQVPNPETAQISGEPTSAAASIKSSTDSAGGAQRSKGNEYVPLTDQRLTEAVSHLIRFLTDRRQKLSKALNKQDPDAREILSRMATQVDTALLKSYMMNNDALVGPLLRVQNHCDVQECEKILRERKVCSRREICQKGSHNFTCLTSFFATFRNSKNWSIFIIVKGYMIKHWSYYEILARMILDRCTVYLQQSCICNS